MLTATVQSLVLLLDNARLLAQLRDELTLIERSHARIELSAGAEPLGLGNGLAEALHRVLAVHPAVHLDAADIRADPEVEQVAYFVVTAAVGNAIMHAGPGATVTVRVTGAGAPSPDGAPESLEIEVQDNGAGGADPSGHGLILMADQVSNINGTLTVDSPPRTGTTIRAVLPRHGA